MKKLLEQKQTLDDVSELIRLMESEINGLRNIVACYKASYGKGIFLSNPHFSDNESFYLINTSVGFSCEVFDSDITKLKSNHQIIKELINKLS